MKKAILIITSIVLAVQLTLLQPLQTQAVGVDTVVKLVGGKSVVRALAEKTGMAMSKKQLDNAVSYIERKTYDGDQKAIDFVNKANAVTPSGTGSKSGFQKYVLDPLFWLAGVDLIIGAYDAFKDGYNSGTPVQIYGGNVNNYPGVVTFSSNPNGWVYFQTSTQQMVYVWENPSGYAKVSPYNTTDTQIEIYPLGAYKVYVKDYPYTASTFTQNGGGTLASGRLTRWISPTNVTMGSGSSPKDYTPTQQDVVDVSNVSPTIINNFSNDTYNTGTTYNIEIEMPDSPNYDDLAPWNAEDPQIEKEVDPVVPDTDGDGLPDDVDPYPLDPTNEPTDKPEGSSWWEWLLGPLKAIGDFFTNIVSWLISMIIPTGETVTGIFNGISDSFKAKLPIADQLGSFFGEIEKATVQEATAPTFEMTMPPEYGGGTFSIIDFSYFDQWRTWILNFIRFTAWFIFLKRLYNRIPKMIY